MALAPKVKQATVNETLRDRGIAHAVYLEKLKSSEAALVLAHYTDDVVPDLIAKLTARLLKIEERGYDIGPDVTKRLQEMLEVMQETVDAWTSGLSSDLADRVVKIGQAEVGWQADLFRTVLPVAWDTVVPAVGIVKAAILESPIDGVLLEDIVGRLSAGTKANVEKAIRIGITEGESVPKIAARLKQVTDFSGTTAEAVTRTAVGHASNAGRSSFYQENADLIKAVQWHATLDTRTCPSCGALDGKTFDIDKGARPPRHINCRCTTSPVIRSMKELGFDLADFPLSTRASMDGQVPGTTTFNQWLKGMPADVQDDALGKTRGALFRTGKVDVKDFVNQQGDTVDLKSLRAREAKAFEKAGV